MKTMFKCLLAMLMMLAPMMVQAREDKLTALLEECLERERLSPDSIEYNLQLLERERLGQTGVRRAVYDVILASLYAERSYTDVTGEWRKRSIALFREALADPEMLYRAPTSEWVPLVSRGKHEKIYGSSMLHVLWQQACHWASDSVMTKEQLLEFYTAHGNTRPQEVADERARLLDLNDSIWEHAPKMNIWMAEAYYPGDSLRLTLDTANVTYVEWKVRDAKGRLLGKNVLTAPLQPGRYTLEAMAGTDIRLNKPTRAAKVGFVVSRLHFFSMFMPGRQPRVTVVDARSGRPIPEAKILMDKKKQTIRVTLEGDTCLPERKYYGSYIYNAPATDYSARAAIYTDRAVYRPGQKIRLSAVLYEQKHWDARVRAGHTCEVKLLDKEHKTLVDTTVTSDDFGVVAADLDIPANVELGWHNLSVDGTVQGVRIEEYKRPTFYVEMDEHCGGKDGIMPVPLAKAVAGGEADGDAAPEDTIVTVTGRAMNYDGTPLRGGRVIASSYRICCWWWRYGSERQDRRQLDTVYTDMEGRFVVKVPVKRTAEFRYFPRLGVEVSVLSAQGETQTATTALRLFPDPPQEQTPQRKEWCECPVDSFDAGSPARLELRNLPGEERYVFLTSFAGESVVTDTMIHLRDTLLTMDIPYEKRYGDGLTMKVVTVRNGRVYVKNISLRKHLPETRLTFHWDTFRDHTRPGATEQWTLRVTDTNGNPVHANVMMGMYDASLDAFAPNRWSLFIYRGHHLPYSRVNYTNNYYRHAQSLGLNFDVWTHDIFCPKTSHIDGKYYLRRGYVREFMGACQPYAMPKAMRVRGTANLERAVNDAVVLQEAVVEHTKELAGVIGGLPDEETDEAAFDAVQLRADFSETAMFMPRLRTDADGRVQVTFTVPQSLTTWQLNTMAHTGDLNTGVLSEKVVARKVLATKVSVPRFARERDHLSFTVAVANTGDTRQTGKMQVQVMDASTGKVLMKKKVAFSVEQERDTVYTFSMPVAEGLKGLTFKAVAVAEQDSDGEQREIPVLAAVADAVDSKALDLQPGESVTYRVSDLFPKGARDRRLMVEKVLDPVQTAIDALPEVINPRWEDALSYAAAYYAADKLDRADTTLFIHKLYSMQKPDGGMPWFDGFASSPYITREVGYLLARLDNDNAMADKVLRGIKRYLLGRLKSDMAWRKKHDSDWTASLSDLRSLYVMVKDGKADKEMLSMTRQVLKRLPEDLKQRDGEYIAIAMIVKHALKEAVLKDGVKELGARLQHKDGVYLAYRGGDWLSIDRRLDIHTQVMEAWQTVCPTDTQTIRGMQKWLLRQKRTQGWKTPMNCVNAVYALTGGNVSRPAGGTAPVQRDTVDLDKTNRIVVANDGDRMIWASVYAEYTLPLEEVKAEGMDISLERSLTVASPRVGDRVEEKMLIDAARDYEYLVLSVPHGAASEPVARLSGCGYEWGVGYYRQVRDDRTDYFIPSLPHGRYILTTEYTIQRKGVYSTGVPTIRCCYAEEFRAHGVSERVEVKAMEK